MTGWSSGNASEGVERASEGVERGVVEVRTEKSMCLKTALPATTLTSMPSSPPKGEHSNSR